LASISVGHFTLSHRRPLCLKRRGAFNRYVVARPVSNQNITGMNIGHRAHHKTGQETRGSGLELTTDQASGHVSSS
jgi:hypothetical protein